MPKTDLTFNPDDYTLVADRIALFYERYPTGRIIPRLHAVTESAVIFEALVYREKDDRHPAATGWAREFEGDGPINEVACLENTETSAIGRALANLGFAASRKRASYEEMMKADRARRRMSHGKDLPARRATTQALARDNDAESEHLQVRANAALDLIRRIRIAERLGLPHHRVKRLVERVSEPDISDRDLARLDQAVVSWLSRHNETRFHSQSGP